MMVQRTTEKARKAARRFGRIKVLEPGSSCQVIFKSQKQFLILGKFFFWSSCYFFGAPATFLELLLLFGAPAGSSTWWRELGETPSACSGISQNNFEPSWIHGLCGP